MSDIRSKGFGMDRSAQREMLERLRQAYPNDVGIWSGDQGAPSDAERGLLIYLEEHGLCSSGNRLLGRGNWAWDGGSRLTAPGLDFLEQDGGLTSILGVVTVKLHADTIRDRLAVKVHGSDLPPEKKAGIKAALRSLPGAALTAGTGDLVKMGLDHAPGAVQWIERLVRLVG